MKKTVLSLLSVLSSLGFASEMPVERTALPMEEAPSKKGLLYITFEAVSDEMSPGANIGYRRFSGNHGVDISFGGYRRATVDSEGNSVYAVGADWPRVDYLHMLHPQEFASPYFGGGASWSTIVNPRTTFDGIVVNGVAGYAFALGNSAQSFVELEARQAIIAAYSEGSHPSPSLVMKVGAGF